MPSGMLPRSPASRRGRSQEGSCCPESCPRTPTSTRLPRLDKYSRRGYKEVPQRRQDENGDKKSRAARELLKDAIYMATKAVDKYSRRGYKEVRRQEERRQEGSCCAESCSRTPSTWLPRLSTSTAGEATKKSENGDKTRTATRRLVLRRELLKDAKRAGHR